jgi:hypothetical protein
MRRLFPVGGATIDDLFRHFIIRLKNQLPECSTKLRCRARKHPLDENIDYSGGLDLGFGRVSES